MSAKAAARAINPIGQFRAQLDQAMAQLADTRAEVDRLRSELELEESRPVPREVVEERAAATVDRLRGFVARQVSTGDLFSRHGGRVGDYLARLSASPFAVAAVVAPDELKSWLVTEAAAAMQSLPEPVDDATRTKRVADLKLRVWEAEGREIDLCWELLDTGVEFDWRPGLDPALVLGLEGHR
jgi:hypothetical protein